MKLNINLSDYLKAGGKVENLNPEIDKITVIYQTSTGLGRLNALSIESTDKFNITNSPLFELGIHDGKAGTRYHKFSSDCIELELDVILELPVSYTV